MTNKSFKPSTRLRPDQILPDTVSAALRRAERVQPYLLRHLAEPLASHCRPVRLSDGELLLVVDSSAWASRLRAQQRSLLEAIRASGFSELRRIRVRVSPPNKVGRPQSHKPKISSQTAHNLKQTADTITDPELRQALRKLGRHGKLDPS